jgi:serine/threonine protein kinase
VFHQLHPDDPRELGGYRILARLGAGGMGQVYLARTQSGRRLAVKVVRPEFVDDPEFRRRFRQEVMAAERVQSRYTAPVIDADPDGPRPWLATAYVPGPSMAQAVAEQGPLPADTVRVLTAGVAEALQAIHAADVVHRDLKPSNVLLAPDGPRVIDFGIARAADSTPLTRTGVRIGSPQFMAPEQALGQPAGPAVDVFALGSLVFFAATGRSPFGEGPDAAVLFRIVHEEPDLDGCPDALRSTVERCLAKDPLRRSGVGEIIGALRPEATPPSSVWLPPTITERLPVYTTEPPPPPPVGPPARQVTINRSVLIAAGVVVMLAVAVALGSIDSPGSPADDGTGGAAQTTTTTTVSQAQSASSQQPTAAQQPQQQQEAAPTYLTDLEPVKSDSLFGKWTNGPVVLDGRDFTRGMTADLTGTPDCGLVREYALSRGYRRFRATLGLSDDSTDTSATSVKVTGDGRTLRSETIQLGRTAEVDVDVHDLVRLGLEVSSDTCDDVTVAFGDPRLEQ